MQGSEDINTDLRRASGGNGATSDLPFPETGYSPALQRTLQEKFNQGDIGGMDKAEFLKQLGQTAKPEQPAEE